MAAGRRAAAAYRHTLFLQIHLAASIRAGHRRARFLKSSFPPLRRCRVIIEGALLSEKRLALSHFHPAPVPRRISRASLNSRAERFNGRMSATSVQRSVLPTDIEDSPAGVNNFTIVAATVNGSGSQTANNTLLRALFKMGIPVSGKNIFPSNIQGLPTWFSIRVSKDGFIARRETAEIVVALNRGTASNEIGRAH